MTTETERVSAALQDIASWYSETEDTERGPVGPSVVNIESNTTTEMTHRWGRLALVAVLVVAAIGAAGLVANGAQSPVPAEPGALDEGLERGTVVGLCLEVDTAYDLDDLRSSGTVHSFSPTGAGELGLVLSTGSLHVACGLAKRDDSWFRTVSVVGTHQPLAAAGDVSVEVVVELRGKVYVAGQAGTDVQSLTIDRGGERVLAKVDGGWWGGYFDSAGIPIEVVVPDFAIQWSTKAGSERAADGVDLLQDRAWLLCAQDNECSDSRLTELYELALGSGSTTQSDILADRIVTDEEYRSVLQDWGNCIGQTTGSEITYDTNGLFTVRGSNSDTAEAFEECKQRHAALIIEAVGLRGTSAGG